MAGFRRLFGSVSRFSGPAERLFGPLGRPFGRDAKTDHTHPLRLAAFALLTILVLDGWAWSVSAHADEALLPGVSDDVPTDAEADSDPTDMGVAPVGDEPRGQDLVDALDAYLDVNFPASGIPGLAVAVVDSDGIRYLRTLGDVPNAHSTFIVGSLSKSMTSVAVQQLVDEGKLDLDAPVELYVPDYSAATGAAGANVTVRDLLNQTSGFGYYESLANAVSGDSAGVFSYSNANYDLLGRIIERVSGLSYDEYMHERVFAPLGMEDASASEDVDPTAHGHRNYFGQAVADGFSHERGDGAWGGPASGYIRASINDMASYLRMYLNSGAGVVSAPGVHRMVWNRVPDPGGDTFYGMGWTTFTWDDGELVMSHDGDVENYVARMCVIPGRDLGIVLLADANDAVGGNGAFWQIGDDVTSLAVGGSTVGVDFADDTLIHVYYDAAYLLAAVACAMPLLLISRWARRWKEARGRVERGVRAAWALALHVAVPLMTLEVPSSFDMRFRDFADFYPEQAIVIVACTALLFAGGLAKFARTLNLGSDPKLLVARRRRARDAAPRPPRG